MRFAETSRSLSIFYVLGLIALVGLSSCTRSVIPADLDSGINGMMLAGPQCPVQGLGIVGCEDKPFQGTVIVKTQDGSSEVTRFTAEADGGFRVPLYPGTYLLHPLPGPNGFPHASDESVRVDAGSFTQVNISYDTGIR